MTSFHGIANDPLLSCAIMLEMLDVLMQSDRPFRHNLIFLFNGAEENLLPVSRDVTACTLLLCSEQVCQGELSTRQFISFNFLSSCR